MSNRSVKFVPALVAGVVAAASLATMTDLRAQVITTSAEAATPATQAAADSCLSAPKGATPSGSHWYYRIDRVTRRQCWYLREESDTANDKFARAAPPASAPARSAARAGAVAATNHLAQVDRRRTRRMGLPATPRRAESARRRGDRERLPTPPPRRPPRMPRAPPCRTCSRRRRCRRCDGMTLPHARSLANPADLQVAAASPPGRPAAAGRGSAAARAGSGRARRSGRRDGKADRLAAEAAAGDGRRACAGRPHGKRDRQDRPHAGPPRHAPQAPRDVGFRQDEEARRSRATDMFHDEDAGLRRAAAAAQSARAAGPDTARPRAAACTARNGRARPRSGACAAGSRAAGTTPQTRPAAGSRRAGRQVTEMLSRLARSAQT